MHGTAGSGGSGFGAGGLVSIALRLRGTCPARGGRMAGRQHAALGRCGVSRQTHMPRFIAGAVSAKIVTCYKSANIRNQ